MSGKRKLKKSIKKFGKTKEDIIIYVPALLGLAIGGSQKVAISSRPGFVYARVRSDLNEVVQAYNDTVPLIYNLPVVLARNKTDKTKWYVVGRDIGRYSDWGTSTYLPDHHGKHQFDPNYPGNDIVWIYDRQFMPHLIYPSGTGAGCVLLSPHAYYASGTWSYSDLQASPDLLTYKPTTGSMARVVLVYMDYDDTLKVLAGDYLAENQTGTASIITALPILPTTSADPVSAVRLVTGTSIVEWVNIYDVRQFHNRAGVPGTNGTNGLPGPPGNGMIVYDDSVYKVSGSSISFNAGLIVSITGSVAYIDWTGSAGVTDHGALTGLLDDDHPQYRLTGTVIDHGGLGGLTDNDHPQYLLTGTSVGVTDHGALTGLTDDDHTQYLLRQPIANQVINENGGDFDLRVEGDSSQYLFVINAGLNAVQIGFDGAGGGAGAIADFRPGNITINENGVDIDFRIEGDATQYLFIIDAGLDAVQIGSNASAGCIADFRNSIIVFNEDGAQRDIRFESLNNQNMFYLDASINGIGFGTSNVKNSIQINGNMGFMDNGSFIWNKYYSGGWKYIDNGGGGHLQCPTAGGMYFYVHAVNAAGADAAVTGEVNSITILVTGDVGIKTASPTSPLYIVGNCSADSFTDRTPYPESKEIAYIALNSVTAKDGKLDHEKLHQFIRRDIEVEDKIIDEETGEEKIISTHTEYERNISALLSVQTEVLKDLIARIKKLEKS